MALSKQPETGSTLAKRPVKDIYAVSRLVREARSVLEGSFPLLWVEGELSNLATPASGHIYFTLKDEAAQIRCAMFKGRNRQLRFTPENGMQVLLRVRVTLYEGRGEFQLVVEHMEEAGSGALQRAYEALKYRLGEAGLFDEAHKKALPVIPQTLGIISSPTGAAVHDILTVLQRRFPACNVIVYPVAVQGSGSAQQIANAIALANERRECDLLIVGRGGGSLEDLWSFNEEHVANAIFASKLPIISAVGHEIDFTIADFVADVRAPTPSAAAEIAVPDAAQWLNKLNNQQQRLTLLMRHYLQNEQSHMGQLRRRLPEPWIMIRQQMQTLDRLDQQLQRTWQRLMVQRQQRVDYLSLRLKHPQSKLDNQKYKVSQLSARLQRVISLDNEKRQRYFSILKQRLQMQSPRPALEKQQYRFSQLQVKLQRLMRQKLTDNRAQLQQQMRTLAAVSPLNTLERGYSITTDQVSGHIITKNEQVEIGQNVKIQLQKGQLYCLVEGVEK